MINWLQAADQWSVVGGLIERWGLPLVGLVFLLRWGLPFVVRQLESNHKLLVDQLQAANDRATKQGDQFVNALAEQRKQMEGVIDRFDETMGRQKRSVRK